MLRTPGRRKSSDDVINLVWDSFRANNGIMSLLQLLQTKVPATDADAIRALSCQALVGLARSPTATQIMSKLPIFNNGSLTMLVREPVLPDHRDEHLKFQRYAHELLEKVCVFCSVVDPHRFQCGSGSGSSFLFRYGSLDPDPYQESKTSQVRIWDRL